jgi:cytidylate kinase
VTNSLTIVKRILASRLGSLDSNSGTGFCPIAKGKEFNISEFQILMKTMNNWAFCINSTQVILPKFKREILLKSVFALRKKKN